MKVKAGQRLWKSKNALTAGIEEVVAHKERDCGYFSLEGDSCGFYKLGRDVHTTQEEAISAAEAMRHKKLNSLRMQIKMLEALTF